MLRKPMALPGAVVAASLPMAGLGVASGVGSSSRTAGEVPRCTGKETKGVLCFVQLAIHRLSLEKNGACLYRVIGNGLSPGTHVTHYVKRPPPAGPRSAPFGPLVSPNGTFSDDFGIGPDSSSHATAVTVTVTAAGSRIQIVSNTVTCP